MNGISAKLREKLQDLFTAIAEECAAGEQVSVMLVEMVLVAMDRDFDALDAAVKEIRGKPIALSEGVGS